MMQHFIGLLHHKNNEMSGNSVQQYASKWLLLNKKFLKKHWGRGLTLFDLDFGKSGLNQDW